jgi:hypothetical protein
MRPSYLTPDFFPQPKHTRILLRRKGAIRPCLSEDVDVWVSLGRGGDARDEMIIPLACFRRGRGAVNVAAVVDPREESAPIGKVSTGRMGSYAAGAIGAVCATSTGRSTRARRLKCCVLSSCKERRKRYIPTK